MNINYSGQKNIFFFYFSRNKISFLPPIPPPNFHLQFKMVRRASDDFILSFFFKFNEYFPHREYFLSLVQFYSDLRLSPTSFHNSGRRGKDCQNFCTSVTTVTLQWVLFTLDIIKYQKIIDHYV